MNMQVVRHPLILCAIALIATLAGCRTASVSGFTVSKKAIRVDRPMFDVFATRITDTSAQLRFVTTTTLRADDNTIRYVDINVASSNGGHDSLLVFPTIAREDSSDGTIYIVGEALWESPSLRTASSFDADVSVVTASNHIIFSQTIDIREPVALDLYPSLSASSDTSVMFRCLARRAFVPRGEYLPSSEVFRIRVRDEHGEIVWSSDTDMAFLALVSLVQPQTLGRLHIYEMPWNGRMLNGRRIKPGTYRAEFIIPSRPLEYSTSRDFTWPIR